VTCRSFGTRSCTEHGWCEDIDLASNIYDNMQSCRMSAWSLIVQGCDAAIAVCETLCSAYPSSRALCWPAASIGDVSRLPSTLHLLSRCVCQTGHITGEMGKRKYSQLPIPAGDQIDDAAFIANVRSRIHTYVLIPGVWASKSCCQYHHHLGVHPCVSRCCLYRCQQRHCRKFFGIPWKCFLGSARLRRCHEPPR
jgi:hypothetical protein